MTLADIVPETLLARTYFELLASSSLGRYARYARSAARHPQVRNAIALRGASPVEILDMAQDTWRFLVRQRHRDEREADLAIILAILSDSADRRVDEFLRQVGMIDLPSLSWVSAFARFVSSQRAASEIARRLVAQQTILFVGTRQQEPMSSTLYRGSLSAIQARQDPRSVATRYVYAA